MKQALTVAVMFFLCLVLGAETAARTYPVPRPKNPPTRLQDGIKGPVKSRTSQSEGFPAYYSEKGYSQDGKLIYTSGGRSNLSYETHYSYDAKGFLINSRTTEWGNGEEYPTDLSNFSYELDELGYPLVIRETDMNGDVISLEKYSYSDTSYSVEASRHPGRYDSFESHTLMSLYDSQGRLVASDSYSGDRIDASWDYAYIPARNTVVSYRNLEDGIWWERVVTRNNDQGKRIEESTYDSQDLMLSKLTISYDKYGNVTREQWYTASENRSAVTDYSYSYDPYGNPTAQTLVSDEYGEERTEFSYTYF